MASHNHCPRREQREGTASAGSDDLLGVRYTCCSGHALLVRAWARHATALGRPWTPISRHVRSPRRSRLNSRPSRCHGLMLLTECSGLHPAHRCCPNESSASVNPVAFSGGVERIVALSRISREGISLQPFITILDRDFVIYGFHMLVLDRMRLSFLGALHTMAESGFGQETISHVECPFGGRHRGILKGSAQLTSWSFRGDPGKPGKGSCPRKSRAFRFIANPGTGHS